MEILPLTEIPFVKEGDDLSELILESADAQKISIEEGDIIVIAQTVVSKAEGKVVDLRNIEASERAKDLSKRIDEDPRKVEVILQETNEVIRVDHVLIAETKHGFICANAGVDSSNVRSDLVTILPEDPDRSAREIKEKIEKSIGKEVAVIISDSWGRPFRFGAVGFAVGIAGIDPLQYLKGKKDAYGNKLKTTMIAPPDSIAAAASLVMGEANEEIPVVFVKDAPYKTGEGSVHELIRPEERDLFR